MTMRPLDENGESFETQQIRQKLLESVRKDRLMTRCRNDVHALTTDNPANDEEYLRFLSMVIGEKIAEIMDKRAKEDDE